MKPEISVILPCYNVSRWVEKCIKSIWNNDFTNYEIICVNDCSTDNTLQILNKLAEKDSRIKVIDLPQNGGLANGRKVGVKNALGNYVTFIDPDDWVDSNYLSSLYNPIKVYDGLDLIIMPYCYKEFRFCPSIKYGTFDKGLKKDIGKPIDINNKHKVMETFFGRNVFSVSAWNKLYKTSVLNQIPDINVFYQEDLLLNMYAAKNIKRILFLDNICYHYRSGGGSATNPKMITDFLEVIRLKTLWLKENIADYEQHLPWICFELKNVIYAWISRLIAEGKSKKALQTLYFNTIKDSHLEFLASTKFSAPKSFASEDFQALLSRDFDRIYVQSKSRVSFKSKISNFFRKLLSY